MFATPKGGDSTLESSGYTSWAQTGGYFDGDGSVYLRIDSEFLLKFALVWVDNSRDQLLQLRRFLISNGVAAGNVLQHSTNVCRLQIGSPAAALLAAKQLVPYCFKKRQELQILVDYYENRITGSEGVSRINAMVRLNVRLGRVRTVPKMACYDEGKRESARARGRSAAKTRLAIKMRDVTQAS